jgi:hypothetical protein
MPNTKAHRDNLSKKDRESIRGTLAIRPHPTCTEAQPGTVPQQNISPLLVSPPTFCLIR